MPIPPPGIGWGMPIPPPGIGRGLSIPPPGIGQGDKKGKPPSHSTPHSPPRHEHIHSTKHKTTPCRIHHHDTKTSSTYTTTTQRSTSPPHAAFTTTTPTHPLSTLQPLNETQDHPTPHSPSRHQHIHYLHYNHSTKHKSTPRRNHHHDTNISTTYTTTNQRSTSPPHAAFTTTTPTHPLPPTSTTSPTPQQLTTPQRSPPLVQSAPTTPLPHNNYQPLQHINYNRLYVKETHTLHEVVEPCPGGSMLNFLPTRTPTGVPCLRSLAPVLTGLEGSHAGPPFYTQGDTVTPAGLSRKDARLVALSTTPHTTNDNITKPSLAYPNATYKIVAPPTTPHTINDNSITTPPPNRNLLACSMYAHHLLQSTFHHMAHYNINTTTTAHQPYDPPPERADSTT